MQGDASAGALDAAFGVIGDELVHMQLKYAPGPEEDTETGEANAEEVDGQDEHGGR